jgi:glycerol-3-phosphate dehydrogenase
MTEPSDIRRRPPAAAPDLPGPVAEARAGALARLGGGVDLVVIGAGINGAGIAWAAALRGLRVLLLDRRDIGSGTSSFSSRLIHGGVKYLEHYDVALVRESLREREWLLWAAPHLVRPLKFVLPFYRRNAHSARLLRAGMLAYDALSFDKSLPTHRVSTAPELLRHYPGLDADGLLGGATYFDAQVALAERLVVETALAARAHGATVLPHAEVTEVGTHNGGSLGVEFTDRLTGQRHRVEADAVINAAGPWADQVLAGSDAGGRRMIGGTKGSHFVVDPFPGAPADAMYYEAVSDGRPLLVIPWLGRYLIGSTDLRFDGDLDTVRSDPDELAYVLAETNRVLPGANLRAAHVLFSYSGVRPLPFDPNKPEGDITRRHLLHAHTEVQGLYSVIGGKLTTFRSLAEETVREVLPRTRLGAGAQRRLGRQGSGRFRRAAPTRGLRLPGGGVGDPGAFADRYLKASALPERSARRLVQLYGTRAAEVEALARRDPSLGAVVDPATGTIAAQVVHAVTEEQALTLTDVIARRTMDGLEPGLGLDTAPKVGQVLVEHLGWSRARVADEIAAYHDAVQRLRP